MKFGINVINLDKQGYVGTHWVAIYITSGELTYFDSLSVERFPKIIEKFADRRNIIGNIYGTQTRDSKICGYFSIGFIDFKLNNKSLIGFPKLFLPNNFKENEEKTFEYFQ